jgi:type VI secretion system secreted protein Hcp
MFKDRKTAMVGIIVAALLLPSLILSNPGKALAAYDCFLKVDAVDGEITDSKHKSWIEVFNWSFGETQPGAARRSTAGGATAERVNMKDFMITMRTNKASPKLFLFGASGKHIKEVQLDVCRSTGDKQRFLNIKLSDVMVSSFISIGNSKGAEPIPTEEIMFNFGKIEITYTQMDPSTGKPKGDVNANWDVTTNKGSPN